jgi:hypothetical protein
MLFSVKSLIWLFIKKAYVVFAEKALSKNTFSKKYVFDKTFSVKSP